jgi:hypothetical protein
MKITNLQADSKNDFDLLQLNVRFLIAAKTVILPTWFSN